MRHGRSLCLLAVVTALVLASIPTAGGADPILAHQGKAGGFDACKLLRKSEVAKVIREPVASAKGGKTSTGARYCNWTGSDSAFPHKGITLLAARDYAKYRYSQYKKLLSPTKPVKGIGDAAAMSGSTLIARKDDNRFVYISPLNSHTGITVDALKPLAIKALGRIK